MSKEIQTNRPIGIFDSGLGGLTVYQAVKELLPNEQVVYLGDTARVPYGSRSKATVLEYSRENTRFLESHNVKAVVVACNTASAYALDQLGQEFDLPFLGVIEPGAKAAVAASERQQIGVIATHATIHSAAYVRAINELSHKAQIFSQACPLLVPLVEEGWLEDGASRLILQRYLKPLQIAQIDTLILGCTHYPLLQALLTQILGAKVTLINSAAQTANALHIKLQAHHILAQTRAGDDQFYVTDLSEKFAQVAARFLGHTEINPQLISLSH